MITFLSEGNSLNYTRTRVHRISISNVFLWKIKISFVLFVIVIHHLLSSNNFNNEIEIFVYCSTPSLITCLSLYTIDILIFLIMTYSSWEWPLFLLILPLKGKVNQHFLWNLNSVYILSNFSWSRVRKSFYHTFVWK